MGNLATSEYWLQAGVGKIHNVTPLDLFIRRSFSRCTVIRCCEHRLSIDVENSGYKFTVIILNSVGIAPQRAMQSDNHQHDFKQAYGLFEESTWPPPQLSSPQHRDV